MDKEDESELRIIDKRRFTASGETRSSEAAAPEPQERQSSARAEQRPGATAAAGSPQANAEGREQQGTQVDFPSFIVSLATQALVMMGEIVDPETNRHVFSKEAAQQTIEIIAMLERKTQGNLTEDEQRLVSEVLASLRLAFVRKLREHEKTSTTA